MVCNTIALGKKLFFQVLSMCFGIDFQTFEDVIKIDATTIDIVNKFREKSGEKQFMPNKIWKFTSDIKLRSYIMRKKKGILNTVMNTFLIKKMVNNGFDSKIFLSPPTKSEKSSAPKQPRDCNKYVSPVSRGTR